MKILDEYVFRKQLNYPVAYHPPQSSFLILKSDQSTWGNSYCVLTISWDSNSNFARPGAYRVSLKSPQKRDTLESQSIFSLLDPYNHHFFLEVPYHEFESFFYRWDLLNSKLYPVFGREALLSTWEIFVFANEKWFCQQSRYARNLLADSVNMDLSFSERISSYNSLRKLSFFKDTEKVWNSGFFNPLLNNYLNWFRIFAV